MKPAPSFMRARSEQRGVTLIEVLVGIAIGLVGMLVMFQTLTVWDARTRATTAGGDAQIAGSIAMYNIERDIRLAGMGFGKAVEMGCPLVGFDNVASAAVGFPFTPVVIVDNDLTNQPDELAVLYGSSPFFGGSDERYTNATAFNMQTSSRVGFRAGDLAVVTDGGCTQQPRLIQVTDDPTAVDDKTLSHNFGSGTYTDFYTGTLKNVRYNTAAGTGTTFDSGNLYNLGPLPHRNNWRVLTDTLGYSDDIAVSPFFGVAEGVIDMKAQYGIDTDGNGRITEVAPNEWMKTPPTDWTKVRAIRVALLVRSRNFEKPPASAQEASWVASNPSWSGGNFFMKNLDGTPDSAAFGDPNNWRYYRYKVYERVIPLRNVIWNN